MSYKKWFDDHAHNHAKIIKKLRDKNYSDEEIINYFEHSSMVKNEPDFCPLYKDNKKCHDIEYLSCFLCACPNFRFNDDGLHVNEKGHTVMSSCSINSTKSGIFLHEKKEHLDCSNCIIPHTKKYVSKHFTEDWKEVMRECESKE